MSVSTIQVMYSRFNSLSGIKPLQFSSPIGRDIEITSDIPSPSDRAKRLYAMSVVVKISNWQSDEFVADSYMLPLSPFVVFRIKERSEPKL